MRFIRYRAEDSSVKYGWLFDDKVGEIEGSIFDRYVRHEADTPFDDIALLPPVVPEKIICVGRNFAAHAREHGAEVPDVPLLFFKPPSALIAAGDTILLPPQSIQPEHEAELAIVIGKKGRWILPEKAKEYVCGYTIANDVTARDLQQSDSQWTRGKGFDTFCPLGPWIDTVFNPVDVVITCKVNGELRQMASTIDMVFSVNQLIAFASSFMTLKPGDVILTGTPSGVGPLKPGDIVEVEIEGLGTLKNPVSIEHRQETS